MKILESARVKLTAWYLVIIMIVSVVFSVAFYHAATREIQRVINRIERDQELEASGIHMRPPVPRPRDIFSLNELERLKSRFVVVLALVNAGIFIFAGIAGYFLAGKTLQPIQKMVDEQTEFVANASHELRTPIATLRAEIEAALMEKNVSSSQARTILTSNLEEVEQLQQLSSKLLEFTQLSGTTKIKSLKQVSIEKILSEAVARISKLTKKKHITVALNTIPAQVFGDYEQLVEVLVIVLDNAQKYSPAQTTITISTKTTKQHCQIVVQDEGIGIETSDIPHLFKRFYRADKSRSRTQGFGLGLSIADSIIAAHRGSIRIASTPQLGTTVTITLPLNA